MSFVYVFIFLITIYIVQARILTYAERESIYTDCYQKTGMDREIVAKAIKESALLEPTPAYLAQLTCIYKGQGYQNNDGEIVPNEIKLFLKNVYTEEQCNFILDNCNGTGGTTHGEIAYHALVCILKNLKKIDEQIESENIV